VGSNTVHALVADAVGGQLKDVASCVEMPQLGVEVARTGRLGPAGIKGALAALERVVAEARQHRFDHLVAGATAAVRNAADSAEFLELASRAIGVPVRLLDEEREAELSFLGVASRHAVRERWLMADLGGASLEVVVARGRDITWNLSLPVGSGVLAIHLSDPPVREEREEIRRRAVAVLHNLPEADPRRLVATGGTATNLRQVVAQSRPNILTTKQLLEAADRLDEHPALDVAKHLGLPEPRVKAMRAGVEVLLLLLDWCGLTQLQVSVEGLRHGMLLAYLERGDDWYH